MVRVLQVHASRICDDMIAHESNVAVLGRFVDARPADDASGSSRLRANETEMQRRIARS